MYTSVETKGIQVSHNDDVITDMTHQNDDVIIRDDSFIPSRETIKEIMFSIY